MRPQDLDQVLAIEEASFPRPWTRSMFEAELRRDAAVCLVVREGAAVVGQLIFWQARGEIHVLNLAVRPDRRRRGLGRLLLDYMLAWGREVGARHVYLEVRASNQGALALYEQSGFVRTGRRPNYYAQEKEDAVLMSRRL